ncbi:HEAT repeat domain-containing protein [Elusimicrobiota bacterium]
MTPAFSGELPLIIDWLQTVIWGLLAAVLLLFVMIIIAKALGQAALWYEEKRRGVFMPAIDDIIAGADTGDIDGIRPRRPGDRLIIERLLLETMTPLSGVLVDHLGLLADRAAITACRIRELDAPDLATRAQAAEILGRLGSRASVPRLITALKQESGIFKTVAARSLGRIRDISAIPALVEGLENAGPGAARTFAQAIVSFRYDAVSLILDKLSGMNEHKGRYISVLGEIRALEAVPAAKDLLINGKDQATRKEAARALGRIADPDTAKALCETMKDTDPGVRAMAAWALGKTADAATCENVASFMRDEDPWVRARIAQALAQLGEPGRKKLQELKDHPAEEIRTLAREMLESAAA